MQVVESGKERLKLSERKLPGQDSNLDKENQNLLETERKLNHSKTSGDRPQRLDRALTKPPRESPQMDAGLARLIEAWPTLSGPIRAAMLALIGSSKGEV